jgi:hypothetical protein
MKKLIRIVEESHGTIAVASDFIKAKQYLLDSGWVDEGWYYYTSGSDVGLPIIRVFGENWQEKFLELNEEDFDGSFYFYGIDFME